MFRNYLAAALRNLSRNRLYGAINIIGLAVGLAAAILIALFVRDEFSYDRWIPGYQDVYRVSTIAGLSSGPQASDTSPPDLAGWLRLDFPSMQAVARLWPDQRGVKHGQIEAQEPVLWADPDIFKVFPLPVVAGDLTTALSQPDSVVLTRTLARKYFGRDDPIGQTLEIDGVHPLRVTAVLRDIPSDSHLALGIVASGKAPFSTLAQLDAMSSAGRTKPWAAFTYFRLRPGASVDPILAAMPSFIDRHMPGYRMMAHLVMPVTPIAAIHLQPPAIGAMTPRGDLATVTAIAAVGLLIVLVAGVNFVNLMTARAGRRAVEIGVRKLAGAGQGDLMIQFIGESLIYIVLSAVLALGLSALLLAPLNAFLGRSIRFGFVQDPALFAALAALVAGLGVLAGAYPAFVLSAFRPAAVLKGGVIQGGGSAAVRQTLIALQFAVLIGLFISTVVIYRQTIFATKESLRLNGDQMLLVQAPCASQTTETEIEALPGVMGAACSMQLPLSITLPTEVWLANGSHTTLYYNSVGFGFFELYGLKPVAGRFFSRARGVDLSKSDDPSLESIVLNETAVRKLGFASAAAAIGKTITWAHLKTMDGVFAPPHPALVIGVVPDFNMGSIRKLIEPAGFYVDPSQLQTINVKLRGHDIPETLRAIDHLWVRLGRPGPAQRVFFDQAVQGLYRDVVRQGELFAMFAGVSMLIACLGLVGLAAFATERRTKEIGVRKAMGAGRWDILKLFLWQFTQPVLLANLIAWPIALLVMTHWLRGFAYHIALTPWPFVIAALAALVIAWLTVLFQAIAVAAAKPVDALRYE